jgi:aspartyl-tRNA(Asn)/glutamyl-tRNA(Gln) amidotransferase subunit A
MPLGLTLDHMGPLTRTVRDAGIVLDAIAGPDPGDESTLDRPKDPVASETSLKRVRIGRPENFFNERLHPEVAAAWDGALRAAESEGAEIVRLRVPDPEEINVIARTILLCEASAVLMPHVNRRQDIGEDVLSLFDQGRTLAATDYINAQRVRRRMISDWVRSVEGIDVLCTPATPIPAPAIGEKTVLLGGAEEDARLASTRFVRGINVMGVPAISIPCGTTSSGLPIGLQLIAKPWQEARLIEIAAALEATLTPNRSPGT